MRYGLFLFSTFIITAILETIFLFIRYNATVPSKAKSIYTFVVLIIKQPYHTFLTPHQRPD